MGEDSYQIMCKGLLCECDLIGSGVMNVTQHINAAL